MMRHIKLLILLYLPCQVALGEGLPDTISYFCNANRSEISIDMEEQSSSLKRDGFTKDTVNWGGLLEFGSEKNGRGEPLKSGSKIAISQCGMIQIRIESGFVNDDIEGQSGALDFPIIELRIGERTAVERTALEICSVDDRRANVYFGACPNYWAQSIKTRMQSDGSIEAEIKRQFFGRHGETKKIVEKRKIY
jgi:hypothetical protein